MCIIIKPWFWRLPGKIIFNNPTQNCIIKGHKIKLGDSHQLKKELKTLFLLSLGGVLPMLKMVFFA
tara:strand:+ start:701 stop:898 length:198 start_codon:yes stop_codon:yes gene_type:complete